MRKLFYNFPTGAAYGLIACLLWQFLPVNAAQAYGGNNTQAKSMFEVTIAASYKNASLTEVFSDIESKTDFVFTYDKNDAYLHARYNRASGRAAGSSR